VINYQIRGYLSYLPIFHKKIRINHFKSIEIYCGCFKDDLIVNQKIFISDSFIWNHQMIFITLKQIKFHTRFELVSFAVFLIFLTNYFLFMRKKMIIK
jgi:hypothetical protein